MIRSITIFSFFALATVLVIVLQPGPRPAYVYDEATGASAGTTRNEVNILPEPDPAPTLKAPDNVLARLKAAANGTGAETAPQIAEPEAAAPARSVDRLQAALNASLGTSPAVADQTRPELRAPAPAAVPAPAVAPAVNADLRAMSWQTLNALNGLSDQAKAPGQEGSLLNSIVRRSMGQVTGEAVRVGGPSGTPNAATRQPVQQSAALGGGYQTYIVESGDTLALIAIKLYGSALASSRVLDDNPDLRANPNALRIGQALRYRTN